MTVSDDPKISVKYAKEDLDEVGLLPWFSYSIALPIRIPTVSERSEKPLQTHRLMVRPLTPSDLDGFHKLRTNAELQNKSFSRGCPSKDREESRLHLGQLQCQSPKDVAHWYWGAFLASTGELIGEGGIFDTGGHSRSGWPEVDFLIAPGYQRQGYGSEFYQAVMQAWWGLPREYRRQQVHPFVVPGKEAGDRVMECVVHSWDKVNRVADKFFTKVVDQDPEPLKGAFEDFDHREGRRTDMVEFIGWTVPNPLLSERPDEDSERDEDAH